MPPTYHTLRPVHGRRIFEEILDQLERAILDGHVSAGDRLPPERELAELFGASRTSVREALRVLEALGIARVRAGAENGAVLVQEPSDSLQLLLRFHLALKHISIQDVIEYRQVVERWTAAAASQRAGGDALDALGELLESMREQDTPADFHRLDASFHLEIARAAGNELVIVVLQGARSAIERIMLDMLGRVPDWAAARTRILNEHREILEAIRARDADAAASRMEAHIKDFYASVS